MNKLHAKLPQLFVILALLLTSLAVSSPAAAACTTLIGGNGFVNGNWADVILSVPIEAGTTITFAATHAAMGSDYISLEYSGPATDMVFANDTQISWTTTLTVSGNYTFSVLAHGNFTYTLSYASAGCDEPAPSDGRLCRWDHYAVYTDGDSVDVYGIADSKGFLILSVSQFELDALPGEDGVNTLIESSEDGEVQVYRLEDSDVLQVHAGIDFVRFRGLPASDVVCGTVEL